MKRILPVVLLLGLLAGGGCFIIATPDGLAVGIDLTPRYSYIPGTQIAVVTNASGDVFRYGGAYYRWWNGLWWRSSVWHGGWVRAAVVPDVFLSIPASHPKYYVVRHHPRFRARIRVPFKAVKTHIKKKSTPATPPEYPHKPKKDDHKKKKKK